MPDPMSRDRASDRRRVVAGAVVLVAAAVTGAALLRAADQEPTADLTVGWGGSEGHPSCLYHPETGSADATLLIQGEAGERDHVTVTVTAYADENTSAPVGSARRSVPLDETMDLRLVVTIPVDSAPHVDEDGEAACALVVSD